MTHMAHIQNGVNAAQNGSTRCNEYTHHIVTCVYIYIYTYMYIYVYIVNSHRCTSHDHDVDHHQRFCLQP